MRHAFLCVLSLAGPLFFGGCGHFDHEEQPYAWNQSKLMLTANLRGFPDWSYQDIISAHETTDETGRQTGFLSIHLQNDPEVENKDNSLPKDKGQDKDKDKDKGKEKEKDKGKGKGKGKGDGKAELLAPLRIATGPDPRALAVEDINEDGKMDILLAHRQKNSSSPGYAVTIFYQSQQKPWTFNVQASINLGKELPVAIAALKDSEAPPRLIVAVKNRTQLLVFKQAPPGTFQTTPELLEIGCEATALATGILKDPPKKPVAVQGEPPGRAEPPEISSKIPVRDLCVPHSGCQVPTRKAALQPMLVTRHAFAPTQKQAKPLFCVYQPERLQKQYSKSQDLIIGTPTGVKVLFHAETPGKCRPEAFFELNRPVAALRLACLEKEGKRDIITANKTLNADISILLQQETCDPQPKFSGPFHIPTGGHFATAVAAGPTESLKKEGYCRPILAVAHEGPPGKTGSITIMRPDLSKSSETKFLSPEHYPGYFKPLAVELGYLDGDGQLYLATSDGALLLRTQNSDGLFSSPYNLNVQ